MRFFGILLCFLLIILETYSQGVAPYPYKQPDDLNPADYQELNEDSSPEPFSCQENFTGYFKMALHLTEDVLDAEDSTFSFQTDKLEWTESDENTLEHKLNRESQALLKLIFRQNDLAVDEFLDDIQKDIYYFLGVWQENMCDKKCEKVGYVCDSKVWLNWIDTSGLRCEYRTTFSFLEEGSDSNQVTQVVTPALIYDGWFYFKHTCNCKLAEDAISTIVPPWDQIRLTGTYMKPGMAFRVPEVIEKSPFPWWVPVTGGGVVAGGMTTYLLTRDDNDTPQEPLILKNDQLVIECGVEGGVLDVLRNDQGAELTILSVNDVSGGQLNVQQNTIVVSGLSDQMIRFRYAAEDKYGNTASAEVLIRINSSSLRAVDDHYETRHFSVGGNLLDNDMGSGIAIVHHESPPDGKLVIEPNGAFNYTGTGRDTGQIQFFYVIEDKCKNRDTALCLIDINPPPCEMESTVETTPAQCGRADGSAVISVVPKGEYRYAWPDGSPLSERNDLAAGTYEVIISSEYCADTISIEIQENPAGYALQATGVPGNCVDGGDIDLTFDHSLDGDLIIAVSGPSGNAEYFTSDQSGVSVSDYAPVLPGNYTIEVWNALSGRSCAQTTEVLVPDNTPELIVNDDVLSTAFMTAIEVNVLSNDMGLGLVLSGVQETTGGQVTSSEDGTVVFTPGEEFSGTASFRYIATDGCGHEAEGQVTITVGEPDCTMNAEIATQKANCGRADGSAVIKVSPEGEYRYAWPDGSSLSERNDLAAGAYEVIIRSEYCADTASIEIQEKPAGYALQATGIPGNCVEGGDIDLAFNHSLNGDLIITVSGPSGSAEYSTTNRTRVSVSDYAPVLPGNYTIEVWNALSGRSCSQTTEVLVPDNTPELIVNDDVYTTGFMTPIETNVLSNDMGPGLVLSSIKEVTGGLVTSSENGSVVFTPRDEFSGTASFRYIVTDGCGRGGEGQVTITVGEPDCAMNAEFATQMANCGRADGSAVITISPERNYQYTWSDGTTGPELSNVVSGHYSVEVRREGTPCLATYEVTIGEKKADYINDVQTLPVTCKSDGEIQLDLNVPNSGKLVVQVTFEDNFYEVITGSTPIFLSEYLPVMAGDYKLKVFAKNIGMACQEEAEATVEDIRNYPKIKLTDKLPPTSYSSADGVVAGKIVVPTTPPYGIYLNGKAVLITFENQFKIGNMGYGEYAVFVVDANGCQSNTEAGVFLPEGKLQFYLESGFVTSYLTDQQSEHPDQYNPYVFLSNQIKGVLQRRNNITSFSGGYGLAEFAEGRIFQRYETTLSKGVRKYWFGRSVELDGGMAWSMVNNLRNFDWKDQQYGIFLGSAIHRKHTNSLPGLFRISLEGYIYLSAPQYGEFRFKMGF